jgi:hypothetical protein
VPVLRVVLEPSPLHRKLIWWLFVGRVGSGRLGRLLPAVVSAAAGMFIFSAVWCSAGQLAAVCAASFSAGTCFCCFPAV